MARKCPEVDRDCDFGPGFDPARDARGFRDALGQFATGVTVVTCAGPEGPLGIAANSFSSVSLEPPLVLWSPARASRRFAAFEAATAYAIHVLRADQAAFCSAISRDGGDFTGADWALDDLGVPVITNVLARFDCLREAVYPGGDHAIILGRVRRAARGAGAPLVFAQGAYGGFAALP